MTENAFPFDDDVEEVVAERNTRRLVAVVAGVAALALVGGLVVYPALTGGGDDDTVVPVRRRPAATAALPSPSVSRTPQAVLTDTFQDTVGRDPFRPLYAPPPQGVVGIVGGQPGAPDAPGGPAAPGNPGTGSGTGSGSGTGTGGTGTDPGPGGSAQVGGNRVSLVDVFVRDGRTFAQTRVGSTVYTPRVGDTFATNYQLLSASGECATFLYGDENFQLCEGQEVLK